MAHVSGQGGKQNLNISALVIPSQKPGAGKAVTKMMDAGTRTAPSTAQTTAFQNPAKGEVDIGVIQPLTTAGHEEWRIWRCRSDAHAFLQITMKNGSG